MSLTRFERLSLAHQVHTIALLERPLTKEKKASYKRQIDALLNGVDPHLDQETGEFYDAAVFYDGIRIHNL